MNYTSVKNPRFITQSTSAIELTVIFDALPEEVTFIAKPSDPEPHGRELYYKAIAGEFGPIAEFVPPLVSYDVLTADLRNKMTTLLNTQARALRFSSIDEAMTYVDEPSVPLYQQQALALRKWRSIVRSVVEDVIDANQLFVPDEVIKSLPPFQL